jgi:glycosyltransferase involved in cell wall biosynthesis
VIVDHGQNGLLVPVRSVEPLAEAIEALILDPALRQAMGRAGREKIRSGLSRDQVNHATVSIYADLTDGPAAVSAQLAEAGHVS